MQQLTCKIDLSISFFIFSSLFIIFSSKTLCFEGESPGGKSAKKCEKL